LDWSLNDRVFGTRSSRVGPRDLSFRAPSSWATGPSLTARWSSRPTTS